MGIQLHQPRSSIFIMRPDYFVCTGRNKPSAKDVLFVESHGYSLVEEGMHFWLRITEDVPEHTDYNGKCFLYCAKGTGTLTVRYSENGGRPYTRHISPGKSVVFDDTKPHSFVLTSDEVVCLVCDVAKRKGKHE